MTEKETRLSRIRRLFGEHARLVEHPDRCEIWLAGGSLVGSGRTFGAAVANGLAFLRPDMVVQASSLLPADRTRHKATAKRCVDVRAIGGQP